MFSIPVKLENGNSFYLKEVSFADYKNFCKSFNFHTDLEAIKYSLNGLLNSCLDEATSVDTNVVEKILLLLKIRSLVLGNSVILKTKESERAFNIATIYNAFNKKYETFTYEWGMITIKSIEIGPPKNFIVTASDIVENARDSKVNCMNTVMGPIPALPFKAIFDKQKEVYKDLTLTLQLADDQTLELNLFDTSFLSFFKFVLAENLNDIMEKEYILRKELGFTSYDFEKMPYIECNIILNRLLKESKEKNEKMAGDTLKIK